MASLLNTIQTQRFLQGFDAKLIIATGVRTHPNYWDFPPSQKPPFGNPWLNPPKLFSVIGGCWDNRLFHVELRALYTHNSRENIIFSEFLCVRAPPKGAGKKVPRENCRKVSKNLLTFFDDFWRFLPCATSVEKCRKTFRHFLTIFDVFWRGPFPPAPFAIR